MSELDALMHDDRQMTHDEVVARIEFNHIVASRLFGWRWISYIGIPMRGSPGYPSKQRVRQFLSPESLARPEWQSLLRDHEQGDPNGARDADGTEPLSYSYCSSQGPTRVPDFGGREDDMSLKWARKRWRKQSDEWELFHALCPHACDYQPGDYSRAVLAVLDGKDSGS